MVVECGDCKKSHEDVEVILYLREGEEMDEFIWLCPKCAGR